MHGIRATAPAVALALAAGLALGTCGGDGGNGETEQETATAGAPLEPDPSRPLSPAEEHGRQLFVENCGSCHTLDAAGTQGQIGPDLGDLRRNEQEVLTAIRRGGRGSGNMPPNLVTGDDAADVAAFVAGSSRGAPAP